MPFFGINKKDEAREAVVLIFSLLFQGLSIMQFFMIRERLVFEERFSWQFFLLLGCSLFISLLMFLTPVKKGFFLLLKYLFIFLIGYPLRTYVWLELYLLISVILEISLYFYDWKAYLFYGISLLELVLFLLPRNAFEQDVSSGKTVDILSVLFLLLLTVWMINRTAWTARRNQQQSILIAKQDAALERLTKANLGYQAYSTNLELDTLKKERNRVSREIHDSVGYSLTNIRVMLDAVSLLMDEDPRQARSLIRKSMEEAGICLEETRAAMRQLRSKEINRPKGIRAFFELMQVFSEATGIKVSAEFGNVPSSYGSKIDKVIIRFIQEGLTNSFRHGRATEIAVFFWQSKGYLTVRIQDNGCGVSDLHEGIGLSGMRERLDEVQGRLHFQSISSGFKLEALIPLEVSHD